MESGARVARFVAWDGMSQGPRRCGGPQKVFSLVKKKQLLAALWSAVVRGQVLRGLQHVVERADPAGDEALVISSEPRWADHEIGKKHRKAVHRQQAREASRLGRVSGGQERGEVRTGGSKGDRGQERRARATWHRIRQTMSCAEA